MWNRMRTTKYYHPSYVLYRHDIIVTVTEAGLVSIGGDSFRMQLTPTQAETVRVALNDLLEDTEEVAGER